MPRRAARFAGTLPLARIDALLPLHFLLPAAKVRGIAFLTDPAAVDAALADCGDP